MSTNSIDDGGQAFPIDPHQRKGMTLRDYFAAKAMQGWVANPTSSAELPIEATPQDLAQVAAIWAYLTADAMIKARGA